MIYNGQVLRSLPVNLSKLVCKGKINEFAGKRRFKINDFVIVWKQEVGIEKISLLIH